MAGLDGELSAVAAAVSGANARRPLSLVLVLSLLATGRPSLLGRLLTAGHLGVARRLLILLRCRILFESFLLRIVSLLVLVLSAGITLARRSNRRI